ncbi:protein obstructor-E-like, partial [Pollicipes pollicipes]|uniref:protein obstructor-E-like n=1 Tax=Pollicipes pollicipes TaxID=41117 RepID=UPI0018853EFD
WAIPVALGAETFTCPPDETTGKFADPDECDKYWDCFRGTPEPVYCPDGHAFDPALIHLREPCDYIFSVDCTGRELLGDPLGTGVCVRENGLYAHEDPNICDRYYTCKKNVPTLRLCPPGLHFNLDLRSCDWPEGAQRGACGALQTLDNITCDPSQEFFFTSANQKIVHPTFPHPTDCQRFYVCKNGIAPSIGRCDEGLVYSTATFACEKPADVPDCADYYNSPDADLSVRS